MTRKKFLVLYALRSALYDFTDEGPYPLSYAEDPNRNIETARHELEKIMTGNDGTLSIYAAAERLEISREQLTAAEERIRIGIGLCLIPVV